MNRPTERRKYNTAEILQLVYRHFVVDKAPRCANQGGMGTCIYGQTGCAVGCLLTAEDAERLDRHGGMPVDAVKLSYPEIYDSYFENHQLPLLTALQRAHDGDGMQDTNEKNTGVRMRMIGAIKALSTIERTYI